MTKSMAMCDHGRQGNRKWLKKTCWALVGRFGDVTDGTLLNKVNGIRLERGPPEPIGEEMNGGRNSWVTCAG